MNIHYNHLKYIRDNVDFKKLKLLSSISFDEICSYGEPYKLLFLIYYGHIDYIKNTYTLKNIEEATHMYMTAFYKVIIYNNDINFLEYLINIGVDIDYIGYRGDNIYFIAAMYGKIKIMKYLENIDFDINYKNIWGDNAYLIAVRNNRLNTMKYLTKRGINTNLINQNYDNDFTLSLRFYKLKIIKYLIDIGRDIYVPTVYCNTDIKDTKMINFIINNKYIKALNIMFFHFPNYIDYKLNLIKQNEYNFFYFYLFI